MKKLLQDIADICAGQGAPQGDENYCDNGTPFVKAGNLADLVAGGRIEDVQKVSEAVVQTYKLRKYPPGTVLFAKSGMSCLKGYVYVLPCAAYVVNHLACIVPNEDISDFLQLYFLRHKPNRLVKDAAYPSISLSDIGNLEIDLPDEEPRQRVVAILNLAKQVIAKRRAQLAALDELIKARFVEMFGDPIKNSKGLPVQHMAQRYHLKAGTTTPADAIHEFSPGEYEIPCYGGNGIRGYVAANTYEGTYPIIGRQGALCGNVQFATGKFHATEHAVLVTSLREDNLVWTYHLLKLMNLFRFHAGAAQPGLAVKTLNEVDVLVADKALQKQFEDFAIRVEAAKTTIQRSLAETQRLFDSQLQEHFG